MFFYTSRSLIRRYRETRIYVTEVVFSRNGEPIRFFLFIPENHSEIEIEVAAIFRKKRFRKSGETMIFASIPREYKLILMLDNRRGNHYVYCRLDTFRHILQQYTVPEASLLPKPPYSLAFAAAASEQTQAKSSADEMLRNKIIFIDTRTFVHAPELAAHLIKHNDIILSPYYSFELDALAVPKTDKNRLIDLIESLSLAHKGRLRTNEYVDFSIRNLTASDLSDEGEYLLILASQQRIDRSQIAFVTQNDDLFVKAQHQQYAVFRPTGLPPRSQRHGKRKEKE